jgi:hypothetical protein
VTEEAGCNDVATRQDGDILDLTAHDRRSGEIGLPRQGGRGCGEQGESNHEGRHRRAAGCHRERDEERAQRTGPTV